MAKPSDTDLDWEVRKNRIVGLGERSFHKSYYPQLRENLSRLERFRTLLDHTPDFVILVALPQGRVIDANAALGQLLGVPAETLVGAPLESLGIAEADAILATLREDMGRDIAPGAEQPPHARIVPCGPDQEPAWLELSYSVAILEGASYGVLVGRDVTERQRNHAMLETLLAEKEALLENALVGIVMVRQRQVITCNRRFEEMFGYPAGAMSGHSTRIIYPSDAVFTAFGDEAYGALAQDPGFRGSLVLMRADGSRFWCEVAGRALDSRHPDAGSIWVFTDISERKAAEARAQFLAYHDVLTGLPNRLLAEDRLVQALSFAARSGSRVALLVVDLDQFKRVNDSLGHSVGDKLLVEVAARLRDCMQDGETLCRQGGDEFLILLPDLADSEATVAFLAKLNDSLVAPFQIDGHELGTTVSVGIAIYPDDGADFETLQKKADTAMYRAKGAGRNTYRFFNEDMNEDAAEQLTLHAGLRRGLELGQFVLHYQPQFEISSGMLVGAEALIRWQHPELGLLAPGRFIPVAEESGLIVPIGDWVLRQACLEAARWQTHGLAQMVVAVNLSTLQFKWGDIETSVMQALEASGIDPCQLELELTESILIHDTEKVLATIKRLKHMGVRLSIDDFGTGYSSLSYLRRFEVDKLKIDQSFIRELASNAEDAAIVRAIIQMARSLGLRTIAEGIEDRQAADQLRLYHCDEAQGHFYARPMAAADFIARFASGGA